MSFSQLPAVKEKDTKNGAPGIFFGPSFFVTALVPDSVLAWDCFGFVSCTISKLVKDPSDFHNILGNKNDCWLGVGQSNFYEVDGGMEESGRVLWKCVSPLDKQDNSHGTSFLYTEKSISSNLWYFKQLQVTD